MPQPLLESVRARLFPPRARFAAAALQEFAALNLLELGARLGADALAPAEVARAPLPYLARRLFFFSLLPALLFQVARRLTAAHVTVLGDELRARHAGGELEIPARSIAALRPWRLPLPAPGFDVVLASGRRWGLSLPDPAPLARALARAARLPEAVADASAFRDARARRVLRLAHHPALKLGLVPAALTFLLFRLHQRIAYGGLTGEWQLYGFRRWLHTLIGVSIEGFGALAICATVLRVTVEVAALAAARLPAPWGARARIALEAAAAAVFYGGLGLALWLRLVAG